MRYETAGDPMTDLKWTRKTTAKIAAELQSAGIEVSPRTVARLLEQMGYSLRVNHKKLARVSKTTTPQERDAQFVHISKLREDFAARGLPMISVDTKKKELVGLFRNPGVAWNLQPVKVNDHDFPSDAIGKVAPYGIYDIQANCGTVYVGTSRDTPEFAVNSIEAWWIEEGRQRYPDTKELAILADGGGSNGSRCRAWKHGLQRFAERHGLMVTVAHYPPGASKWNPIEHKLFSEISKNWAGRPLDSYETVVNYIRSTTTKTGLAVKAHLAERQYETGVKITDAQMKQLHVTWHESLPRWNYTLAPAGNG